jgi:DNA-binding transcriptional ArsR family regulator
MPDNKSLDSSQQLDQLVITDPSVVPILFHEEKQRVLGMLIQAEHTIQELSTSLKINPGTIKRHITDLTDCYLVVQTRTEINEYGIKLKYYRATAKRFIVNLSWPKIRP